MTLITAIKYQLCNPCNKNLCFIKLKQVLNAKVYNLGKTASRFLFWGVLICGDLLYHVKMPAKRQWKIVHEQFYVFSSLI